MALSAAERQRAYRQRHPEYRAREVERTARWRNKYPALAYLSNMASHRRLKGNA